MPTDYYKELGVARTATADEIKSAYRKLARKHHPDLNPNDEAAKKRFQEINEANEVLSDPESRKKYDKYGEHWKHAEQIEAQEKERAKQGAGSFGGGSGPGFEGFSSGGHNMSEEEMNDLFGNIFGGRGGGRREAKYRGQDYQAESNLDLMGARTTHKQTLNVNGKQLRITVPAGVENGQTIRIPGQGGPGVNGGPNGDLYITFIIAEHPKFKRTGNDLNTTVEINLSTAMLGGEVLVETMDGKVKLKAAPGTQSGTRVKLKGKGFPVYKKEGEHGDLYVTFNVKLPTSLTDEQRALFEQLAKTTPQP